MSFVGITNGPEARFDEAVKYIHAVVEDNGHMTPTKIEHRGPVIECAPDEFCQLPYSLIGVVVEYPDNRKAGYGKQHPYRSATVRLYADNPYKDFKVGSMIDGKPSSRLLAAHIDAMQDVPDGVVNVFVHPYEEALDILDGQDDDDLRVSVMGALNASLAVEATRETFGDVMDEIQSVSLRLARSRRLRTGSLTPNTFDMVPTDARTIDANTDIGTIYFAESLQLSDRPDDPAITNTHFEHTLFQDGIDRNTLTRLTIVSVETANRTQKLPAIIQDRTDLNPEDGTYHWYPKSKDEAVGMLAPMLTAAVQFEATAAAFDLDSWKTMRALG